MTTTHEPATAMAQRWAMRTVTLGGVALLAACGSSLTTGSAGSPAGSSAAAAASSPTASAAVPCAQLTSLRTSLTSLSHLAVTPGSAGQIAVDLARVEQSLTALKGTATGAFSAREGQLTKAVNKIGQDARALAGDPSPANLTALEGSVTDLQATAGPVIAELRAVCPAA